MPVHARMLKYLGGHIGAKQGKDHEDQNDHR